MKVFVEDVETVQVEYDNAPFDLDETSMWNDSVWVRFKVLPGDSFQAEVGTQNTYRTPGVCIAEVFCLIEMGDKLLLEMADIIKAAFRSVSYEGVVFRTPSIQSPMREQKWWRVSVHCPFYADEMA